MTNIINDKKFNDIMNRIQSKRIELKLSYQDLANKTGLSKSTLQRYETGSIRNIPLDKLEILANALEVSPMWIIGYDLPIERESSNNINPDSKANIILNNFNLLNEEGKDEAIKRIQELTELSKYKKENVAKLDKSNPSILTKTELSSTLTSSKNTITINQPKKEKLQDYFTTIAAHNDDLTEEEKIIAEQKVLEALKKANLI